MSRVFDCFLYRGEADLLEIRLNELRSVVDRFVISEATRTFANGPKPLHFLDQQSRFGEFLDRIDYVAVDDLPTDATAWEAERAQRDALARGLQACTPDDIIIISDVGEIPSPDVIRSFQGPVSGLRMSVFRYFLNLQDMAVQETQPVASAMCRYEYLRSPQWLREIGRTDNYRNRIVEKGGWRFSHIADDQWLTDRVLGGSQQEAHTAESIRTRLEQQQDLFAEDYGWRFVPLDNGFPAYVVDNQTRFEEIIARPRVLGGPRGDFRRSIYFDQSRPEVLAIVPHHARRIVELGCASGWMGAGLKRRQECHVTGLEISVEAAARASTRLDRVIVGDCEQLDLDSSFEPGEFDCLIAADVLEHLRDPEQLLRRFQRFLAPGASLVFSLPNVRNAGVLGAAAQGYWTYQPEGILDRTHLRFFTRREIENMLTRLGLEAEEWRSVDDAGLAVWEGRGRPTSPTFGVMTLNGLAEDEIREFFVVQWLVRARSAVRPGPGSVAVEPDGLNGLFLRLATAEKTSQELSASLAAQTAQTLHVEAELEQRGQELEQRGLELAEKARAAEDLHDQLVRQEELLAAQTRAAEDMRDQLVRQDELLAAQIRAAQSLRDQLLSREEQLAAQTHAAEDVRSRLELLEEEHERQRLDLQSLITDNALMIGAYRSARLRNEALTRGQAEEAARLKAELAGLRDFLAVVESSRSWRWTRALRSVVDRERAFLASVRGGLRLNAPTQAPARTAPQSTPPTPFPAPVPLPPAIVSPPPEVPEAVEHALQFAPRELPVPRDPHLLPTGRRGRLLCVTHVLPRPPRAGNTYRIDNMLTWLAEQGWDILLVAGEMPGEPFASAHLTETMARYPKVIVCKPDGTLLHNLSAEATLVEGLRGQHPRIFGPLLHEMEDGDSTPQREMVQHTRSFCPDALIELLLHLEKEFDPHVLLAEYVFMTRPLPLLKPGLVKVVDTVDIFSTKDSKVTRFGINDSLALKADVEASYLSRADVLIAMHDEDASALRELAPDREVISAGVAFPVPARLSAPAPRPVVLLVGSSNPMNVKGLQDFLRFAWPLVKRALPDSEFHIVGSVSDPANGRLPGVRRSGPVEDLSGAYADARVVINPAVAGTGLKIKTVEALCHLRPVVAWPAGVHGLDPELLELCRVAHNWFEFAQYVIELATADGVERLFDEQRSELTRRFSPDVVYAELGRALNGSLSGNPGR
jgi:SAM-dependent methyltransferase